MIPLLLLTTAMAHRPSFGDQGMDSSETAYVIEDIDISIVVYKELVCDDPHLWMTFDGLEGQELFVQLGVPEITRLREHRPSVAVLGPGMPALEEPLPFEVPEGLGGYVFSATDTPSDFYEPFTQTSSWIYVEERLTLPADGTGYIIGFQPDDSTGKIWLATGEVEDFSGVSTDEFAAWGPIVREFHEVDEFERDLSFEELDCAADTGEVTEEPESCGCQASGTAWTGLLLFPALLVRRRP